MSCNCNSEPKVKICNSKKAQKTKKADGERGRGKLEMVAESKKAGEQAQQNKSKKEIGDGKSMVRGEEAWV
ncbi:hypothetical protein COLO4_15728 [Corchorus olitorius]|uniref:Uncharacterized protein n=1 Tax=Corchorus olitorius TaxID=93759 RepID=A0A1R3JLI4_9ROSI|nr:hypothetical protein COLO4_15728 [Corchorus olitorius]